MNKKFLFFIVLHFTHNIIFSAVVQEMFFLYHVFHQIFPQLFPFTYNGYQKVFARHMKNSFFSPIVKNNSRFFLSPSICNNSIENISKSIKGLQKYENIPNSLISDCSSVNIPLQQKLIQKLNIVNNAPTVKNLSGVYFLKYFFMSLYFFKNEVKKIENFEPQKIPVEELCRLFMYL